MMVFNRVTVFRFEEKKKKTTAYNTTYHKGPKCRCRHHRYSHKIARKVVE